MLIDRQPNQSINLIRRSERDCVDVLIDESTNQHDDGSRRYVERARRAQWEHIEGIWSNKEAKIEADQGIDDLDQSC
jgi:hypothetical protein